MPQTDRQLDRQNYRLTDTHNHFCVVNKGFDFLNLFNKLMISFETSTFLSTQKKIIKYIFFTTL